MTMRPRSFDDDGAALEAVGELLRRFDALKEPATETGGAPVTTGDAPVEVTVLVASSSARPELRAVADFVCDGVADDVELNAAWLLIEGSTTGTGTVALTEGTYTLADQVVTSLFGGSMHGVDRQSTKLQLATGTVSSVLRVRTGTVVSDLGIIASGSATCTRGALELDDAGSQAHRVQVSTDTGVGIWCDGPTPVVSGCEVAVSTGGTHGIYVASTGAAEGGHIVNNALTIIQQHGIMLDSSASAAPDRVVIAGNTIMRPSDGTADTYDGIHIVNPTSTARARGNVIVGNVIDSDTTSYRDGIRLAGSLVEDTVVCGNHAIGTFSGAVLTDSATDTVTCLSTESVAWQTWTPTYTNFTLGNGTVIARYTRLGDTVVARLHITFGSTTSIDATDPRFSMPVTAAAGYATTDSLGPVSILDSGTAFHSGAVRPWSTTEFNIQTENASGTYVTRVALTSAIPMTWTTGNVLAFTATYEAA